MCWFITLGVPASAKSALDRACAAHSLLGYWGGLSTPTTALFPTGAVCVQVSTGGCSCDLYQSPADPAAADRDTGADARHRARLRAKGWSTAKIERALADQAQADARPSRSQAERAAQTDAFASLLADLVRDAGAIHLFAHSYRGDQNAEPVANAGTITMALPAVLADGFPPDRLVRVH